MSSSPTRKFSDKSRSDAMEVAGIEKGKKLLRDMWDVVAESLCIFAILAILYSIFILAAEVPSGSMENTILPGERLLCFRQAYLLHEVQRGDVIVFHPPTEVSAEPYIKRVIGLPGETIVIQNSGIYIDGAKTPLPEPYLKEEWVSGNDGYVFQVPEGKYFVLGDNRNHSTDARFWSDPYISKESVMAKAIVVYWPLKNAALVH